MGGATSSLPVQRRIGQRERYPSRCGDKSDCEHFQDPLEISFTVTLPVQRAACA